MKKINEVHKRTPREIKVVQFGEGNFLRAFVDYMIDIANEKGVFNQLFSAVRRVSDLTYLNLMEYNKYMGTPQFGYNNNAERKNVKRGYSLFEEFP